MSQISESWMPDSERRDANSSLSQSDFDSRQQGKPAKTVIGIGLLVVLALVLSQMHPAPHDVPENSITTGQATGAR
ncbi:hypothetical protein [Bradyrhizobium sp. G127]|uniref:hypothetical protein n=1 Tax=Bradyrhizobium sp. G127 TaxID=2904800 RepID=UPI001F29E9CD|nr:hypothetical protein [Bradyrhizobium sp. G127]MCF2524064.1 hypothetical protein [Bradyrhizobium sp. G127]